MSHATAQDSHGAPRQRPDPLPRWRARRDHRRRGLSVVELLISLAISATLLTAVAAAFSASSQAIEVNDRVFRATQAARVTMLHLLTEIRNGTVDETSTNTAMRLVTSGTGSSIPQNRTYRFTGGQLRMVLNQNDADPTDDPSYALAKNVLTLDPATQSKFEYGIEPDPTTGFPLVVRVAVTLVVKVGDHEIRLSGTASPRQYIDY